MWFVLFSTFIASVYSVEVKTPYHWPSSEHSKEVFVDTVSSPFFWVPMASAAILQIDHWDQKISAKLSTERPLFHNRTRTDRASDAYRSASSIVMLASSLFVACSETCWDQKALLMATDYVANIFITYSRNAIAYPIDRTRPDGGERSFPSGHATSTATRVSLANINFQHTGWPTLVTTSLQGLNWSLAWLVAYARVEDSAHYPSDVLFGMGFGFFMANMVKRNFYSPELWAKKEENNLVISPEAGFGTLGMDVAFNF